MAFTTLTVPKGSVVKASGMTYVVLWVDERLAQSTAGSLASYGTVNIKQSANPKERIITLDVQKGLEVEESAFVKNTVVAK